MARGCGADPVPKELICRAKCGNSLGGSEWKKTVSKARDEAREFARGLIKLYADRKRVQRPSYGPDSPWQAEMEHTFPWMETPSQHLAIQDVKDDLKTDLMDILTKTERLVLKAIANHKTSREIADTLYVSIKTVENHRNNISRKLNLQGSNSLLKFAFDNKAFI